MYANRKKTKNIEHATLSVNVNKLTDFKEKHLESTISTIILNIIWTTIFFTEEIKTGLKIIADHLRVIAFIISCSKM
jgi:hypothetical protein